MNGNPNIAPLGVSPVTPAQPATGTDSGASRNPRQQAQSTQYRLVIEEGPQKGSFVYKTMDRVTGEVVQQLPREEVVRLLSDENYAKGSVFDTSA